MVRSRKSLPMKRRLLLQIAFRISVTFPIVILLFSCAKKITFLNSTVVPGAEGLVRIERDNNDNYQVDVSVFNLAQASDLTPPGKTYVVWVETEENGTRNIGQINSASGLFSKALKASLQTSVPFKPTRLFITAEDTGNVEHPGMQVVLQTDRFRVN